jgi:hypothetical protein
MLWLVCQWRKKWFFWWDLEIQGIFSTEEKAIAACKNERYFIGPLALDETLPDERMESWPGSYFPKAP